jgi:shikimate kinase
LAESIVVAIITGGLALLGVIITTAATVKKTSNDIETSQAVTNAKIEELTREVREHNNFARRVPVVEEQINGITFRLSALEQQVRDDGK